MWKYERGNNLLHTGDQNQPEKTFSSPIITEAASYYIFSIDETIHNFSPGHLDKLYTSNKKDT